MVYQNANQSQNNQQLPNTSQRGTTTAQQGMEFEGHKPNIGRLGGNAWYAAPSKTTLESRELTPVAPGVEEFVGKPGLFILS
jgi:hypothetical protein